MKKTFWDRMAKIYDRFMKLVGFRQYSKWSSDSYLDLLWKQGWTVQKFEVLKASFPLTYVECVKE